MITPDRETLRAETHAYEYAERRIKLYAFEKRRQQQQRRDFFAQLRTIRSSSTADNASTAVFHGTKQLTTKQRLKMEREKREREQAEREERERERKEELARRRGMGPIRKCAECRTIYRGNTDTCGCRPCAHCGKRFRGDGFKCEPCKNDPNLVTAHGTETRSFVPHREAQLKIDPLSAESNRIAALLDEVPEWMRQAIELRYLFKLTDHAAAETLMIPVPVFTGRARAAVARVAELLANDERVPV